MTEIARYCFLLLILSECPCHGQEPVVVSQKHQSQKAGEFLFEVQPRVIVAGETAILRWNIKGATKVMIEEASTSKRGLHSLGTFGGSGTLKISPKESTTYVMTCEGSTTYTCASATIRVQVKKQN
jgi:hypothetical protein